MSITELRSALRSLINKEDDPEILEAVYTILNKTNRDAEIRAEMTARVNEAEEDIKAGRVYSVEEAKEQIAAKFRK